MDERDKRISDLVDDVCDFCPRCTGDCGYLTIFGKIVDANYRRADEVRKETFEEVIAKLTGYLDREFLEKVLGVEDKNND